MNLDAAPKPNQTTNNGASAIFGMLWNATTRGLLRIANSRTYKLIVARSSPIAQPSA